MLIPESRRSCSEGSVCVRLLVEEFSCVSSKAISTTESMLKTEGVDFLCPLFGMLGGCSDREGALLSGVWERGGSGGASSAVPSGQEFLRGVVGSVGVAIECLSNLGDGGFVKERSLLCVGFGGSGISFDSESDLDFRDGKLE